MTKFDSSPVTFIVCCIVTSVAMMFLADPVWEFLFEFFYEAHLVYPQMGQTGAEEMGIAFADTLTTPALWVLWIASSYLLYRIAR